MNWLVVVSVIAAVVSAVAAVVIVKDTVRTFERGAELQALLEFTKRYEKIAGLLPASARLSDDWGPEVDANFMIRLRYLNMCSEEFYLKEAAILSQKVWNIWAKEMRATLGSRPYVDAWPTLCHEFESYDSFRQFVKDAMAAGAGADA